MTRSIIYSRRTKAMHAVNRLLHLFGFRLSRVDKRNECLVEVAKYKEALARANRNKRGFVVFEEPRFTDGGVHPEDYRHYECGFATSEIKRFAPNKILDVGSYRLFVYGLLSHYRVTTIDVRERKSTVANEEVITCDARSLDLPNDCFDVVLSLSSLEHFGLGRYGDSFDLDADIKAVSEMKRVLRAGGIMVFTTTISRAKPSISFNAHRIYDYDMIQTLCAGLMCVAEKNYSRKLSMYCS